MRDCFLLFVVTVGSGFVPIPFLCVIVVQPKYLFSVRRKWSRNRMPGL